jgi:hypothetical protein
MTGRDWKPFAIAFGGLLALGTVAAIVGRKKVTDS